MREIKFRVWNKKRNMSRGCMGINWSSDAMMVNATESELNYEPLVNMSGYPDEFIIMQFTGLKDRNGKEIYEGDVVQGKNRLFENQVMAQKVFFLNGCFMFGNWNAHEYFNKHTEIEVIGNIYENPELLKHE